ncbi:MAG: methylmalonyl Co-A mutase-associated GTPase MeaB, partial [bacterium]
MLQQFESGSRAACARIITLIENDEPEGVDILSRVYSRVGKAHRIGVTGPPGAGKSTFVEKLAASFRKGGRSLAVIAVDPTSPFSGGAILGDRIRMSSLFTDPDVFIRSMATRGSLGGLALKTKEVCALLDAFGKDIILIETVGVGQAELDVAQAAHTT